MVKTLKCLAGAEDLIRLLGAVQLSMPQLHFECLAELDTVRSTFDGAMYLALQLVQQEIGGSAPLERSFRALCRHRNVHTNLETLLPRYSAGVALCFRLSCALRLLAAFAVQLPGQDTPMLLGAEAYGNAAVAYFNAGKFEPAAWGEACTAGFADT